MCCTRTEWSSGKKKKGGKNHYLSYRYWCNPPDRPTIHKKNWCAASSGNDKQHRFNLTKNTPQRQQGHQFTSLHKQKVRVRNIHHFFNSFLNICSKISLKSFQLAFNTVMKVSNTGLNILLTKVHAGCADPLSSLWRQMVRTEIWAAVKPPCSWTIKQKKWSKHAKLSFGGTEKMFPCRCWNSHLYIYSIFIHIYWIWISKLWTGCQTNLLVWVRRLCIGSYLHNKTNNSAARRADLRRPWTHLTQKYITQLYP